MKKLKTRFVYLAALLLMITLGSSYTLRRESHQTDSNYKIAYIAEQGSSGRDIILMDTKGNQDKNFKSPDLPGKYFNGITSSQNGKRLAFMRDIEGIDSYSLWRMNWDGSGLKRLTQKGKRGLFPSMSDDGSKIVFTRKDRGVWEIFTIGFDGNGLEKVTNFRESKKRPGWGAYASWSPDGKQIVYSIRFQGGNGSEIYLMDANGQNTKQLTDNNYTDNSPDFSPDGKYIAYNSLANGTTRETILLDVKSGERKGLGNVASGFGLQWSPDGKQIAYSGTIGSKSDIFIMNADGSNQKRLTSAPGFEISPCWIYTGER